MESAIVLHFEKKTKNYWKFRQTDGLNTLYLKPTPGQEPPNVITAVIETGRIV